MDTAISGGGRQGGFAVVPVIDLRHGLVVRARAGERDAYAPIATPLAKDASPGAVAGGLMAALPVRILYVADLDAIVDGAAPDIASLAAIAGACPDAVLWVDAGFAAARTLENFLLSGLGRPVIGSESQTGPELLRRFRDEAVLSLDSRGEAILGPSGLHEQAGDWPDDVIVMTLGRVGAGTGPDLAALGRVRALAPKTRLYAAGGVRGPADIEALRRAGVAGELVASAIHDGTLRAEHLVGA